VHSKEKIIYKPVLNSIDSIVLDKTVILMLCQSINEK